ncbi:unnamed protein product [Discula destructiva]
MRLIKIDTLKLEEFMPNDIPPFAILSHTWGADEVSYAEMMNADRSIIRKKSGYQKIVGFCNFVESTEDGAGLKYVWVDTCCIDKTSSAELSEAINSMYFWYSISYVCVVYLSDYTNGTGMPMKDSRWWTRGWTLQELLAPQTMIFVDKDWDFSGSKNSLDSLKQIEEASGIDRSVLITQSPDATTMHACSIATRMSWAAKRKTTRPEDMAYCLMGLFQVNMPLLYGEGGERAFIRLQEEIIKESDDQSIFLWNPSPDRLPTFSMASPAAQVYLGALAIHPSEFIDTSGCELLPGTVKEPHSVTVWGIKLDLNVINYVPYKREIICLTRFERANEKFRGRYCIPLILVPGAGSTQIYSRDSQPLLLLDPDSSDYRRTRQGIFLLKRTKVLNDREVLKFVDEIHLAAPVVTWKRSTGLCKLTMVVYTIDGISIALQCDSTDLRHLERTVRLGHDGKATVFFHVSLDRSRLVPPFMLGIAKNFENGRVTLGLESLTRQRNVERKDMPKLHDKLHRFVKPQDLVVKIPCGRGWTRFLLQKQGEDESMDVSSWYPPQTSLSRLRGSASGRVKTKIHLALKLSKCRL